MQADTRTAEPRRWLTDRRAAGRRGLSVLAAGVTGGPNNVGTHVLRIPDDESLVGLEVFLQALVFEPGGGAARLTNAPAVVVQG